MPVCRSASPSILSCCRAMARRSICIRRETASSAYLFGNIVIFVVFTTIWPVSVANVVRTNLARALEQLATLVGLELAAMARCRPPLGRRTKGRSGRQSRRHARSWSTIRSKRRRCGAPPGGGRSMRPWWNRSVGCSSRFRRSSICVPIWPGTPFREPTQDAIRAHHLALAGWFRQAASWTRSGEGAGEVVAGLPEPPILSGPDDHLTALATWYGLLHQDIRRILDEVGPQPQPVTSPPVGGALHAAG